MFRLKDFHWRGLLSFATVAPSFGWGVLLAAVMAAFLGTPAAAQQEQTIFPDTLVPDQVFGNTQRQLGLRFESNALGNIKAIRFYREAAAADPGDPDVFCDRGAHTGYLYDASGTVLDSVVFPPSQVTGWQEAELTAPVMIMPNTEYVVAVDEFGCYGATRNSGLPSDNGQNLTALGGVFSDSADAFPETAPTNNANYFRDIVFEPVPVQDPFVCISGSKSVSVNGPGGPFVRNSKTTENPNTPAANPLIAFIEGANNIPASTVDIPMAFFGGTPVFYKFVITNCGTVDLFNVRVDDCVDVRSVGDDGFLVGGVGQGGEGNCEQPRLIPPFAEIDELVPDEDGVLLPGESVTLFSDDFVGDPIDPNSPNFIDICETYGRVRGEGIVRNDVEFEAEADLNGDGTGETFVFFDELNLVQCKPTIDIEKFTNGYDADDADGFPVATPPAGPGSPDDVGGTQVPVVKIGDPVTWTYVVTNTGGEALTDIMVTDSKGVNVICPSDALDPGDSFTCTAMGTGLNLAGDPESVDGCGSQGQGMTVPTYENLGTVVGFGATSGVQVTDEDPSHYCNPPDVLIEKFTNGYDGDVASGMPAAGQGDFEVGAPQVAEVPIGGDITWTYVVTNNSSETLTNVVVTDDRGVTVTCPSNTLAQGASFTCTATGTAVDLQPGDPNVEGCVSGTGERPTYENLGTVTATGGTTGVSVEDDDPSHYCNPPPPPPCGLTLEKSCEIPPPVSPIVGKCDGKLQQFTVVWNGTGPIDITVGDGLTGSSQTSALPGDEVTFFADGSTNDTIVNISGAVSGQSTFHISCSDRDMDGDTATNEDQQQVSPFGRDCGKDQGDGKGDSGFINQWLLEGFVDNENAVLDCTPDDEIGDSSCTFRAVAADCDFPVNDPDILTFRVSGGDCDASDNAQKPDKTECSGGPINPSQAVDVSVNGDPAFTLQPGETFDVERGGDPEIELFQGSVSQFNKFHASCSQPLQAGDKYGANELVALDGNGLGTTVVYAYQVGNVGPGDLTGITVTDDQLGSVPGSPIGSLAEGASETLTATAFLTSTTMNTATAVAGPTCAATSNPVVVTVLPPPPCDVSIAFKELKSDAIKWTLTNDATERKATVETFTLDFPADYGRIKEVKLDGAIFKAGDSDTYPDGVASGQTIGPDDWTNLEVAKRQLDQGESRTLEVKFTAQSQRFGTKHFSLTLTFKEGCNVTFN